MYGRSQLTRRPIKPITDDELQLMELPQSFSRKDLQKLQESNKWAEHLVEHTRQKAMEVGVGTADRISQKARDAAERMQRHMNAIAVE